VGTHAAACVVNKNDVTPAHGRYKRFGLVTCRDRLNTSQGAAEMTIYTTEKEVLALYEDYKELTEVAKNDKGNAECALLVQTLTGAPKTSLWRRGKKVHDKANNVTAGTAIATFKDDGSYDGNSGVCHAAIYIKQSSVGVEVWDQWRSGHVGQRKADGYFHGLRTCRFVDEAGKKSKSYRRQNDGDEFYVITTD